MVPLWKGRAIIFIEAWRTAPLRKFEVRASDLTRDTTMINAYIGQIAIAKLDYCYASIAPIAAFAKIAAARGIAKRANSRSGQALTRDTTRINNFIGRIAIAKLDYCYASIAPIAAFANIAAANGIARSSALKAG